MKVPPSLIFLKLKLGKALAILFTLMIILGFFPLEQAFPIQIINTKLRFLTSFTFGLIGLLGWVIVCLYYLKVFKNLLTQIVFVLLGFLVLPIVFFTVFSFITLDLNWQDYDVYKNGEDYIVIEYYNSFVTSNLMAPRLVRTKNPTSDIRIIEEKLQLTLPNNKFGGNEFVYNGKTWRKQ